MSKGTTGLFLLLFFLNIAAASDRTVKDRSLFSPSLPRLRVEVAPGFQYIGSFSFRIDNIAEGERFVFAHTDGKHLKRLFIAQFESILPESPEIYRYNFDNAMEMGGHRFRQNNFAYSVAEARKEAPGKEADLTAKFLEAKGYAPIDEWMVSRFLTLGNESRKQELILFYMEPIAPTGLSLKEFYAGEEETDVWKKLSAELKDRAMKAFEVLPW